MWKPPSSCPGLKADGPHFLSGYQMSKGPVGGNLALTDHFGKAVTVRSFGGKYVLIFFGFTHCRVVCPTALALLTASLNRLGTAADKIQPLYVTVDPDRDTP